MKKIIAVILVLAIMMLLAECTKGKSTSSEKESVTVDTYSTVEEDSSATDTDTDTDTDSGNASVLISPEFKKVMDDYEAWFDHYCDVMKRYQEDPSDLELLSEMTDLLAEEAEMFESMENMDQSEMNTAELAYYLEVTARIEKKLLEVAAY